MKTMDDLQALATLKGIRITPKGYKLDGIFYRIADWRLVLNQLDDYNPLANQVAHWLRSAR